MYDTLLLNYEIEISSTGGTCGVPETIIPKIEKASSTLRASQAVPHPSTDRALRRLASGFGRARAYSSRYGR